jgi:hypothetical protein
VPVAVLVVVLAPAAFDLLTLVQSSLNLALAAELVSGFAAAGLAAMWLRFPRTTWLAAASVAAIASCAMRLVGADVAPVLSLLSIVALGIGGAFATSEISPAGA